MITHIDQEEMIEATFRQIIEQYICPILTGSTIGEVVEPSSKSDLATLQKGGQVMHLRPERGSDFKISISRPQPFTLPDKKIVNSIIGEIVENYGKVGDKYNQRIISYAVEIGICKYISPDNYNLLFDVLDGFDTWATRTYEGRKVTFSILIDFEDNKAVSSEYPHIRNIFQEDFCALLSNSVDTCIKISLTGALLEYLKLTEPANQPFTPQRFNSIANSAAADNKICITLTTNGEILVFQKNNLVFSKRRSIWNYFNHEPVLKKIAGGSKYTDEDARKAVYETILDVSFSRTGGCIAFIRTTSIKKLIEEKIVQKTDLISEGLSVKSQAIRRLVNGRNFQNLERVLRKELLGIDGATIIDYNGKIIAVGAIIKIRAGSTGGGRLAATKTLSEFGTAIKISSDGMVKGFKSSNDVLEVLFSFG
ncbi:MAG: hypothetical protein IH598_02300 [Bacteroidales bacterium]|nr:hypothetical protein [Bacteroidales bacterium]